MVTLWVEKCIKQHVRMVSQFDFGVSLSAAIPFFVFMPTDGIAIWPRFLDVTAMSSVFCLFVCRARKGFNVQERAS